MAIKNRIVDNLIDTVKERRENPTLQQQIAEQLAIKADLLEKLIPLREEAARVTPKQVQAKPVAAKQVTAKPVAASPAVKPENKHYEVPPHLTGVERTAFVFYMENLGE